MIIGGDPGGVPGGEVGGGSSIEMSSKHRLQTHSYYSINFGTFFSIDSSSQY